ncbi:MAG: hypothetical protein PHQ64_02220 [Bacilli bacterium]|nr:hypothetical protein [Bacilli bacterium]
MENNNIDLDFELDFEANSLNRINNEVLLTGKEMSILNQFGIDYKNCKDNSELLFKINSYMSEEGFDEEVDMEDLDWVGSEISERNYYKDTNK